jgi:hypothetical protein
MCANRAACDGETARATVPVNGRNACGPGSRVGGDVRRWNCATKSIRHTPVTAARRPFSSQSDEVFSLGSDCRRCTDAGSRRRFLLVGWWLDPVWQSLIGSEQIRIVQLLVQQVVFDGESGKVTITFHPDGIKTCAEDYRQSKLEIVA